MYKQKSLVLQHFKLITKDFDIKTWCNFVIDIFFLSCTFKFQDKKSKKDKKVKTITDGQESETKTEEKKKDKKVL